jgi:hypothetical protein
MTGQYVIDTCCLIDYHHDIFRQPRRLSIRSRRLLHEAFTGSSGVLLSIPSVCFVEIFEKWFQDDELGHRFYSEVFQPIVDNEHVEIRSIDREVMDNLSRLDGNMIGHDLHDKIVLACAMTLDSPLMTIDEDLIAYVQATNVIPAVLR